MPFSRAVEGLSVHRTNVFHFAHGPKSKKKVETFLRFGWMNNVPAMTEIISLPDLFLPTFCALILVQLERILQSEILRFEAF